MGGLHRFIIEQSPCYFFCGAILRMCPQFQHMPNKALMFTEDPSPAGIDATPTLLECIRLLDVHPDRPETFPYVNSDVTAGMENELQVAVSGNRETVDLPQTIEHSCYYANIKLRVKRGDTPWE